MPKDVGCQCVEALEAAGLREVEDGFAATEVGEHGGELVIASDAQHEYETSVQTVGIDGLAQQTDRRPDDGGDVVRHESFN